MYFLQMPLTRSLYREDELIAALKWGIIKGRIKEVLFWSQEALDSNMTPEFLKALLWVWLFTCGPRSIHWMKHFEACMKNPTEDACIHLVVSLTYHLRSCGDNSTFALLGLGLCKHRKQPNTITLQHIPETLPNTPIVRALIQGKLDLAWTILRPNWNVSAWSTLNMVVKVKHPSYIQYIEMLMNGQSWMGSAWMPEWTWCLRALATILTSSVSPLKLLEEPVNYNHILDDYIPHTHLTMRKRRIYEIPHACIYWHTERGALCINKTTESELQINLEDTLSESKYWSSYLPIGYDLAREEFFYNHFPDDIPDEWSMNDRMKSHGYGGVPVGDKINHNVMFNRCLIRWFGNIPCRYIWRGFELSLEEFTQRWHGAQPETLEQGIHEAYEGIEIGRAHV